MVAQPLPIDVGDDEARSLVEYALAQTDRARKSDGRAEVGLFQPDSFPGYDLGPMIHRGGQGIVFRAVQRSTGRTVALKVLRNGLLASDADRTRLKREAEILLHLEHPNIVGIFDSGIKAGHNYFVMDFVDGVPLDEFVRTANLPLCTTLRLFAEVCEAVQAAHAKGVVHRDLKPSNIRVTPDSVPHVLDFGMATMVDRSDPAVATITVTETGHFVGSLPWASPEQARGAWDRVSTRTDVYALGVILYQLATGTFPYSTMGAIADVLTTITESDPKSPRAHNGRVDDELETIILTCLQKEPERRYENSGGVAKDIRRYLAGEPIEAKRSSAWYILRKTVRRHRTIAISAVLIATISVVYASMVTVYYRRARHQAEEARAKFRLAQETVSAVVNEIGRQLAGVSGGVKAERAVMQIAYDRLRLLAEERSDDPALRADMARTLFSLGDIALRLGKDDEGVASLNEALSIRKSLVAEIPDDDELWEELSATYGRLAGAAFARRDYVSQQGFGEQLLGINETLVDRHPDDLRHLRNLASAYSDMADILGHRYELEAGIPYRNRQREILDRVLAIEPDELTRLGLLRTLHANQAGDYEKLGAWDLARAETEKALSIAERAASLDPQNAWWVELSAFHNLVLLGFARNGGDYERARQYGEASQAWMEKLLALAPDDVDFQAFKGTLLLSLAELAQERRDGPTEDAYLDQAHELFEQIATVTSSASFRAYYPSMLLSLGANAYEDGDIEKSRELMSRAIDLRREQLATEPDDIGILIEYSYMMREALPLDLRDYDVSISAAKRAVELSNGGYVFAFYYLAAALDLGGQQEAGAQAKETALSSLPPNEVTARQHLERCWSRRGRAYLSPGEHENGGSRPGDME